jgi:hypothetical protein
VVVVQDQQTRSGQGGQVVDQLGDHDLGRRRPRGVEPGQRPLPAGGRDRLEGGDQVAEDLANLLVALVEGEPGDRAIEPGQPGGQQAGLAGTGRRRQQRAPARIQAGVEVDQQPGPGDQVGAGPGHEQLGRQQRQARGARHPPGQRGGRLIQALEAEVLGLAQVDLVLAARGRAVGDPVGAAALPALLAGGVGARR